MTWEIINADAREIPLKDESVQCCITDPPYGLKFMGKSWDHGVPSIDYWLEIMRVCKPGAFLLAFGGPRTYHRLVCAIEDAGWGIRDQIQWLYGSGFPKSLDVSKAIDLDACRDDLTAKLGRNPIKSELKEAWDRWREIVGQKNGRYDYGFTPEAGAPRRNAPRPNAAINMARAANITEPQTGPAREWRGWGTALKPAWEIIICAQKPFPETTERDIIVANLLRLEAQLWSILPVTTAKKCFQLSPAAHAAASDFAQWNAEQQKSIWDGLCAQTDTSRCVSAISTSLNIVSSWRERLAVHFDGMSMSTIDAGESKISPTIDLKILKSCLSVLTPSAIIKAELQAPGSKLNVLPAARYLNAAVTNISATQELSALDAAIAEGQLLRPAETGLGLRPAWEPIIVARKPIQGTVAENVQKWGAGALNIDECRVGTDENRDRPPRTENNIYGNGKGTNLTASISNNLGRWPANVILDEEAAAMLDQQSVERVGCQPHAINSKNKTYILRA